MYNSATEVIRQTRDLSPEWLIVVVIAYSQNQEIGIELNAAALSFDLQRPQLQL